MKSLIKNSGMLLIFIGVITLIACALTGNVNNNNILFGSAGLIILGLIVYIIINKRIAD